MSDWYIHQQYDKAEAEGSLDYDYEPPDEPYRRVTPLGGGYSLIEEDGLCIIDPDPMEELMERQAEQHAQAEQAAEDEYLRHLESQREDEWRDLEGNEVLPAGDREW